MRQSQQAFTLIELMVVMAIMTVIFSLIGPLAQNQVDKVRASEEWYSFSQLIRALPQTVFVSGLPATVTLQGSTITISRHGTKPQSWQYNHLRFKEQKIQFNQHGFPDNQRIVVRVRQADKQLTLLSSQEKIAGLTP